MNLPHYDLAPSIILSSERSGTNLLRSLLDNHSRICSPVPPHLMPTFEPVRHYYGDLGVRDNTLRLLGDMLDYLTVPYHDWRLNSTKGQVYKTYHPKSLIQVFHALYMEKALSDGKKRFCSKDIESFDYALEIKSEFPSTKFIYLVRDPRDQVASWMRRPINLFTAYDAIQRWTRDQQTCLDLIFHWGIDAHIVHYEDLISDTPKTMSLLLNFLGEKPEDSCFDTDKLKGSSVAWNPYWKNLARPVLRDNKGKYLETLDTEDVAIIETIAKDIMVFHGYSPVTNGNWIPTPTFNEENAIRRERRRTANQAQHHRDMKLLIDKQAYISNLRDHLEETYPQNLTKHVPFARINDISSNTSREIKARIRFLLQAFLGENLGNRIIQNAKNALSSSLDRALKGR